MNLSSLSKRARVGIEKLGGAELADGIAVELPPPGYVRDRIFEIEAELWGGDGTEDHGQDDLVLDLD